MKVKTFVSMILAGVLATGIGYADDQSESVLNDSTNIAANNIGSSDSLEMAAADNDTSQQNNDYTADTTATDDDD